MRSSHDDALLHLADLKAAGAAENKNVMLVEIHTLGDWMIRLKLETVMLETVQEERHLGIICWTCQPFRFV